MQLETCYCYGHVYFRLGFKLKGVLTIRQTYWLLLLTCESCACVHPKNADHQICCCNYVEVASRKKVYTDVTLA